MPPAAGLAILLRVLPALTRATPGSPAPFHSRSSRSQSSARLGLWIFSSRKGAKQGRRESLPLSLSPFHREAPSPPARGHSLSRELFRLDGVEDEGAWLSRGSEREREQLFFTPRLHRATSFATALHKHRLLPGRQGLRRRLRDAWLADDQVPALAVREGPRAARRDPGRRESSQPLPPVP